MAVQVPDPGFARFRSAEWVWSLACAAGLIAAVFMSAPREPVVAPAEAAAPPGWGAQFSSAGGSSKNAVKTHSAWAAFALAEGQTIDPLVAGAGFVAEYSGQVKIEEAGKYRFGIEAQGGTAEIAVFKADGGQLAKVANPATARANTVFTPYVQLAPGETSVTVTFTRKGAGPARLRTLWEMERVKDMGFRAEPIPAWSVSVPKFAAKSAAEGLRARHGRALLGELNCISCHAVSDKARSAVNTSEAPLLGEIGRRASPGWLMKWIADPHKVKPGTAMPDVIGASPQDAADAEAIVHFLVSPHYDAKGANEPVANERTVLSEGRRLFHSVGCVACHGALESPTKAFGDDGISDELPNVKAAAPFGDLGGKWRVGALSEFLMDPLRVHPGGRMPSMSLSREEADLLSAYLVTHFAGGKIEQEPEFKVDAAKAERGKAAFAARGCAACHEIGHNLASVESTMKAPAIAAAMKGCLDPKDSKSPRFELSEEERTALAAGIASLAKCTGENTPIDSLERTIDALNCLACHSKDGVGGPDKAMASYFRALTEADLGDEGSHPPHLTGVGSKLTTPWLSQVLLSGGRGRPYMATRMPQFGEQAVGALAHQLAAQAGVFPDSDKVDPKPSDEIVAAGQKLVGDQGLNCISCHVFGEAPPAGTPGPSITEFAGRLRYEWWKDYIMAPTRFKPGTRMPPFYAAGKGAVTDVYGGDPDKQADAMWAYFTLGEFAPAPSGVPTEKGYVLRVGDRPIVFRSFLQDAGSRGIAVGFPGNGPHFAFDAATCRLVSAWHGAFLDASGAWAGRGGQVTDGQGLSEWTAGRGHAVILRVGTSETAENIFAAKLVTGFKGYTLDKAGVPTFKYTVQRADASGLGAGPVLEIEERFEPSTKSDVLFMRSFVVRGVGGGKALSFWIVADKAGSKGEHQAKLSEIKGGTTEVSKSAEGPSIITVSPTNQEVRLVLEVGK